MPPDMKRLLCMLSVTGMALALPVLPDVNCRVMMSVGDVGVSGRGWSGLEMISFQAALPMTIKVNEGVGWRVGGSLKRSEEGGR